MQLKLLFGGNDFITDLYYRTQMEQSDTDYFPVNEPNIMSASAKITSTFCRMATLEARADKTTSPKVLLLLPAMFLIFGFALGKTMIIYLVNYYLSSLGINSHGMQVQHTFK